LRRVYADDVVRHAFLSAFDKVVLTRRRQHYTGCPH
jgi:hypothetical protein